MNCFHVRPLVRPLTVRKRKAVTASRDRDLEYLRSRSPTPPLPPRNPNRHFSQSRQFQKLASVPVPAPAMQDDHSEIDIDLLPKPLFSRSISLPVHLAPVQIPHPPSTQGLPARSHHRKNRLPPVVIHSAMDTPSRRSSFAPSPSMASTPAASLRSSYSSTSTSPPSTPASSVPSSRARSVATDSRPNSWVFPTTELTSSPSLKRRKTPRKDNLRTLSEQDTRTHVPRISNQRMLASRRMGLGLGW